MHNKPRGAEDDGAATTAELDVRDQAAVLRHVLSLHPETLTEAELLKEMIGSAGETFSQHDRYRRAVRDLARGGLLHVESGPLTPTRAAVLFHELEEAA